MKRQIEVAEVKMKPCKPDPNCEWCHGTGEQDGLMCPCAFEFVGTEKKMMDVEVEALPDGGVRVKM